MTKSFTETRKIFVGRFSELESRFSARFGRSRRQEVWQYARENDFTLVTKDADFGDLSVLRGFPPNVIWIRCGNCKTYDIENILRENFGTIEQLENDKLIGLITLF